MHFPASLRSSGAKNAASVFGAGLIQVCQQVHDPWVKKLLATVISHLKELATCISVSRAINVKQNGQLWS